MVLVDPTQMIVKTSPVPDPLSDSVLQLDTAMKHILENETMSEYDKLTAYQQTLHKYLKRVNQSTSRQWNNEFQSGIQTKTVPDQGITTNEKIIKLEKRVLDSLPKSLRGKGSVLIQHLKEATDLNWNDRGELTVDGDIVEGSNISDLIHETLRSRKTSDTPRGWQRYIDTLVDSNVPREFLSNKARFDRKD